MVATSLLGVSLLCAPLTRRAWLSHSCSGIRGELFTNRDDKIDVCVLAGWLSLGDAIFFLIVWMDGWADLRSGPANACCLKRKKIIMHGEFRYRRTEDDRQSDMCRIGQAATQRASSRGIALAKRGLRVKGMSTRGDWAGSVSKRPACSTRMSCHLTEQSKVLFT